MSLSERKKAQVMLRKCRPPSCGDNVKQEGLVGMKLPS